MSIYLSNKKYLSDYLNFVLIELKSFDQNAPKPQKFKEMYAKAYGVNSYAALVKKTQEGEVTVPSFQSFRPYNDESTYITVELINLLNSTGCQFDFQSIGTCFIQAINNFFEYLDKNDLYGDNVYDEQREYDSILMAATEGL